MKKKYRPLIVGLVLMVFFLGTIVGSTWPDKIYEKIWIVLLIIVLSMGAGMLLEKQDKN